MYLNLAEYDVVKNLYRKMKQDPSITPNQMYLNSVLEASMRTDDSELIHDSLQDFVA